MKLFFTCLAFAMFAIHSSFAGSGRPPKIIFSKAFITSLKQNKGALDGFGAKACACQILLVASNNERERFIAVFAQTSVADNLSVTYAPAMNVLEKEKKHLKGFFFTKIKTTVHVAAPVECDMLYKGIREKYEDIKLYDVLDADALSNKLVTNK